MLRGDDEVERPLRRVFQRRIFCHAVRFAQRDRGHAVTVEPDQFRTFNEQVAVGFLALNEPLQAATYFILILALTMRKSCSEKRQQRQSGSGSVGLKASMPEAVVIFAVEFVNAPVACGKLMIGEPL